MRRFLIAAVLCLALSRPGWAEETNDAYLIFMSGTNGLSYVPLATIAACEEAPPDTPPWQGFPLRARPGKIGG